MEKWQRNLEQDGFVFTTSGFAPESVAPVYTPDTQSRPIRHSTVEFEELADGTLGVVRCEDPYLDDLNLEFEAGGKPVSIIGQKAFQNCQNLQRIVFPGTLKTIEEMAFAGCSRLFSVVIPGSVQKIGTLAFARCQNLTAVHIEAGVTALGPSCFQKCQRLIRVDLPSSITSFGGGVFFGCSKQLCLYGAAGSKGEQYAKLYGIPFDTEDWKTNEHLILTENPDGTLTVAGLRNPGERRIEIPDEICGRAIVAIQDGAFFGNAAIEQAVLGRRIRRVGKNAFMSCTNLSLVVFEYGPERIEESAFAGCENIRQMVLPGGTGQIDRFAFFGCSQLHFVRMPAITKIHALAFEGCSSDLCVYGGVTEG